MRYLALLTAATLLAWSGGPAAAATTPAATPAAASDATAPPLPFADVGGVPWAEPAIAFLAAQGVVKGVSATAFAPDAPVTGESALTFLSRLFPATGTPTTTTIAGVAPWAQAAVAWAVAKGIVADSASFAPSSPAPRDEVVAWVVAALGLPTATTPAPSFADAAAIPVADAAAVGAAQADGIVVGDAQGDFEPAAPVTRAQLALILLRAEEALALDAGTPSQAPYAWRSTSATASADLLSGTATTGSATLPAGSVRAGHLSGAAGTSDYAEAGGVGAGTLVTASGRAPFLWRQPSSTAPGGLWVYAPGAAAPLAYVYTPAAAGGTVQVTAASSLAASLGAGETLTVQPGSAGSPETATATLALGAVAGGASLSLGYAGPALPTAVLIATETAAAAAALTVP